MNRKSQNMEWRTADKRTGNGEFRNSSVPCSAVRNSIWFCVFVLIAALTNEAAGGRLDDLKKQVSEKSVEKKKKEKKTPQPCHHNNACYSAYGAQTYPSSRSDSFIGSFLGWLMMAPTQYHINDPANSSVNQEGWTDDEERASIYPKHTPGQATAPFARIDYNRQHIDSLTDAQEIRVELGYKLAAFHCRATHYDDSDGEPLDINQYYAVLRYGGYRPDFLLGTFEIGLGLGVVQINDETSEDSAEAVTFLIKYYPAEWCGIEFRSAWYEWMEIGMDDYDFSVSLGHRFVQLRAGYRWVEFKDVGINLNGPYAGVSVSF